jgi:hypothetical protein
MFIVAKQAGSVSRVSKRQCRRIYSKRGLTVCSSLLQGDGYGS